MPAKISITLKVLFAFGTLALGVDSSSAATPPLWPSLLVALDRGYQPGLDELPQLATALADAPEEVVIAWDRRGRFLLHQVGSRHTVQITRSQSRQLTDGVVMHNHLRGFPPSPRDFSTVLRYRLRRMYVAARIGGVVSLTDISHEQAMRRSHEGDFPYSQTTWRPVVEAAPAVTIEGPVVIAAQVAHNLLGAWL